MNSNIWKVYSKRADFKAIGEKYCIDQVIARVIRNRDVVGDEAINEYLFGDESFFHAPSLMKGMDEAAGIILKSIEKKEQIRIIGDYDIDGICSIYILHNGLLRAGAVADYVVPHRITDGYGINENIIKDAYDDGVKVIITCDNGIAAKDAVDYAKNLGMTVIITDHHDIPYVLNSFGQKEYCIPDADAVVNPKQADCRYPYKELCGAAVCWKLVQLITKEDVLGTYMQQLLEFAAIATVGDVVPLNGENRIIVKCGIRNIRHGTDNIGLIALIRACGVDINEFSTYHIGFVVGPCLNASGRLESAAKAIELLETDDINQADTRAAHLKFLNEERKEMTERGVEQACTEVDNTFGMKLPDIIVLYLKDCHESVSGIIAGRVRERFNRPVIIFADAAGENGILKASARSIDGYNIYEGISECRELLLKYGGHPMAAGMSLKAENFEKFRKNLNKNASDKNISFEQVTWIDVPMPVDYITENIVVQLKLLEPFGKDNEKPVFADKNLTVLRAALIGKNKNVLKMQLMTNSGRTMDAVMFKASEDELQLALSKQPVAIVYYPDINVYNGRENLQLNVLKMQVSR